MLVVYHATVMLWYNVRKLNSIMQQSDDTTVIPSRLPFPEIAYYMMAFTSALALHVSNLDHCICLSLVIHTDCTKCAPRPLKNGGCFNQCGGVMG